MKKVVSKLEHKLIKSEGKNGQKISNLIKDKLIDEGQQTPKRKKRAHTTHTPHTHAHTPHIPHTCVRTHHTHTHGYIKVTLGQLKSFKPTCQYRGTI